jgi:hypothetical protein
MAAEGRCSSLPLMLVTMKESHRWPEYGSRLHPAVPCQCAIAVFILRDRDGVLRGGRTNVVFHVGLSAETSSHPHRIGRSAHAYIPGLAGRNGAWLRCCQQVRQCCRDRDWVMLEGEKGSGRARLAQAVGRYVKPGRTVRVMRAETFPNAARFVAELAAESGDEDFAVVIADVDDIDKDTLESITSMLAARAGRGWIAATKSSGPPSALIKQLLPLFTHTVTVPALRHRIDDLEELVPLLLREITPGVLMWGWRRMLCANSAGCRGRATSCSCGGF